MSFRRDVLGDCWSKNKLSWWLSHQLSKDIITWPCLWDKWSVGVCGLNVLESALQKETYVIVWLEFGCIKRKMGRSYTENMRIKSQEDLSLRLTSNKDLQRIMALLQFPQQNLEDMTMESMISAFVKSVNDKEMRNNLSRLWWMNFDGVQWIEDECCELSLKCLVEYPWISIHSRYDRFFELRCGGGCMICNCCNEWIMCSLLCIIPREKETTQQSLFASKPLGQGLGNGRFSSACITVEPHDALWFCLSKKPIPQPLQNGDMSVLEAFRSIEWFTQVVHCRQDSFACKVFEPGTYYKSVSLIQSILTSQLDLHCTWVMWLKTPPDIMKLLAWLKDIARHKLLKWCSTSSLIVWMHMALCMIDKLQLDIATLSWVITWWVAYSVLWHMDHPTPSDSSVHQHWTQHNTVMCKMLWTSGQLHDSPALMSSAQPQNHWE